MKSTVVSASTWYSWQYKWLMSRVGEYLHRFRKLSIHIKGGSQSAKDLFLLYSHENTGVHLRLQQDMMKVHYGI